MYTGTNFSLVTAYQLQLTNQRSARIFSVAGVKKGSKVEVSLMDYFLAESAEEQSVVGDVNHSTIHAPFPPNGPYTSYEGPISTNQKNRKLGGI